MQQIEQDIFYEDSYLGVTIGGLLYTHGTIMIDAPLRVEDGRSWRSALLNQRKGSQRLLVILDAHPDRTLGARSMECTIVAHQKTAQVYRNRPMIFKGHNAETGSLWETYSEAVGMRWAAPDITFSQQMSLHWGGDEVILEHHPGTSSGAIWAIIPERKVIFVGDTVVPDQPPFLGDADLPMWQETLEILNKEYGKFTMISGRGGIVDRSHVRAMARLIKKIQSGIDRLATRDAAPEATEKLIPSILKGLDYAPEFQDLYTQRLRYGLHQYYARRFRPTSTLEPVQGEGEE